MGSACQQCMKTFSKKQQQKPTKLKRKQIEDLETDRPIANKITSKQGQARQSSFCKGSNLENQSNSSVKQGTKIFSRIKSTALFSNDGEKRHSSIIQYTLDSQSIIIKNPNQGQLANMTNQEYYTLIQKVAYVKKTMDCIKVNSPAGQFQLNCPPQFMFSTLHVSEGIPVQNIQEIAANRVINVNNSPINIKLLLKCKKCKKKLKMTFSKGFIRINNIQCQNCQSKANFKMLDIESNVPIWGNGKQIENHDQLDEAPSILRAMGCIVCLRFTNCQNLECGCFICKTCLNANEKLALQGMCRMHQGSYVL